MKKIYFGIATVLALVLGITFSLKDGKEISLVSANPDYICIKEVEDQPCVVNSCEPWGKNGERKCYGKQATKVAYYLIRTTCEPGYTRKALGNNVGGNSGRQEPDYPYQTKSCEVIQIDTTPPSGSGSQSTQ